MDYEQIIIRKEHLISLFLEFQSKYRPVKSLAKEISQSVVYGRSVQTLMRPVSSDRICDFISVY
jgi:hypothetical protein